MVQIPTGAAGGLAEALTEAEELGEKRARTKIAQQTLDLQKSKRAGELWGQVDAIHKSTDTPEIRQEKLTRLLPEIERLEGKDAGFYDINAPIFKWTIEGSGKVDEVTKLLGGSDGTPEGDAAAAQRSRLFLENPSLQGPLLTQAENQGLIEVLDKLPTLVGNQQDRQTLARLGVAGAREMLAGSDFFKSYRHKVALDKIFDDPDLLAKAGLPELADELTRTKAEFAAREEGLKTAARETAQKKVRPTLADIRVDIFNKVAKEGGETADLNPLERALFQLDDDEPATVRELVSDLTKTVAQMRNPLTGEPLEQTEKDEVILSAAMSLFPFDDVNAYWEKTRGVKLQRLTSPDGSTKLVEVSPEGKVKVVATEPKGGFFAGARAFIGERLGEIGAGVRAATAATGEEVLTPEGGPAAPPTLSGAKLLATLNTEAEVISAVNGGQATQDEGVARIKELRAAKK